MIIASFILSIISLILILMWTGLVVTIYVRDKNGWRKKETRKEKTARIANVKRTVELMKELNCGNDSSSD